MEDRKEEEFKFNTRNTIDLAELKGELRAVRDTVQSINSKELRALIIAGGLGAIVALAAIGFNINNSSRFEQAIDRAESKIERLSGLQQPREASIELFKDKNGYTIMEATVETIKVGDMKLFQLQLAVAGSMRIKGNNGKLLGYSLTTGGVLHDIMSRPLGIYSELRNRNLAQGDIGINSETGYTVSSKTPFPVTMYFKLNMKTCAEVENAIEKLTKLKPGTSTIGVMPIFSEIEDPPSKHFEFKVKIIRGPYLTCKEKRDFEKGANHSA